MRTQHSGAFRSVTGTVALLVATSMLLITGGAASTAAAPTASAPAVVAKNDNGKLKSVVQGKAPGGYELTGSFTPLKFKDQDGTLVVKGVLDGVLTSKSGQKSKFTAIRTLDVASVNGAAPGAVTGAAATCDVLNLVLGPLDLNVLGLEVKLQRVVLDITAVTGAGNLLGNLLCAVVGLLDGVTLPGLLTQLAGLLNQILAALGLGI